MSINSGIELKTRPLSYYLVVPLLSILLLLFAAFTTGIRSDHVFLVTIIIIAFYTSHYSRRLITGLGIMIVYWVIYDSMKAWPNYAYNTVYIQSLYDAEKNLFGIHEGTGTVTPNEYFLIHSSRFLDILCAIFYLSWIPLPLLFAIYSYFTDKKLFLRFCFAFFIVNCIGFIIYYLYPAAPPWYYSKYGAELITSTKSHAAGLLRFDHYFNINLFSGLYAKGSNVFAAMPSLHASYPLIGLYYSMKQPRRWMSVVFGIVMLGIWFSAIYLTHHYILDVIAGILCGIAGIIFFEKFLMKNKSFRKLFDRYLDAITHRPN
jgi:inositol phosphorylceramide synthase catalytic subunit